MRNRRNSAAAAFCMTMLQQVCNLISVLECTVISRLWLFSFVFLVTQLFLYRPLFTGALADISFLTVVAVFRTAFFISASARSAYSVSPFMISAVISSIEVILRTCLSGFADQLHIVLCAIVGNNALDIIIQTVKTDSVHS